MSDYINVNFRVRDWKGRKDPDRRLFSMLPQIGSKIRLDTELFLVEDIEFVPVEHVNDIERTRMTIHEPCLILKCT